MGKHIQFTDAVRATADGGWGRKFESMEEAQQHLMNNKKDMSSFAMLDIVRRLNVMIRALADDRGSQEPRDTERPEDVAKFTDLSIGDLLYEFDIDEGLTTYVVVAVNKDGTARIIPSNDDYAYRWVFWATNESRTVADAVAKAIKESGNIEYHAKKLRTWEKLAAAVESRNDDELVSIIESEQ